MNLPNDTYYLNGVLINNARNKNSVKSEIAELKNQINILQKELEHVNKRIDEFNNK
jgi:hypothetical protein